MAKKKKTRHQKIIADLRRQMLSKSTNSTPSQVLISTPAPVIKTNFIPKIQPAKAFAYPYLAKDLRKTAMVTSLILASQIILYFILRSHILVIPRLGY